MTNLLYLEHMNKLSCDAIVVDVGEENGKQYVALDQTVFYPQGGGQPYDTGEIKSSNATFAVDEVRYFEGIVKHFGNFLSGTFQKNDTVECMVNKERRLLNSRLHSAGHLVDLAVFDAKPDWVPGKGYHFPDGPYVEYTAVITEEEKESLKQRIEVVMKAKIAEKIPVTILFVTKEELDKYCRHVPENIPEGKPTRIVLFGDFGVPCGGTHVENLSEIGAETIRKIKNEKDRVRVGYEIEQ